MDLILLKDDLVLESLIIINCETNKQHKNQTI